ncbi:MAG TPA: class I SAM-dependent methyltransferase [Armatimonadaceae bacterium]|nr:class I SAM-dependent methyltransferase [Armatimonadaceae bacterium]
MKKNNAVETRRVTSTRELGLDLAHIAARHLFKTDHLHYGYWPADLPVDLANLRRAQENYTDYLVAHLPAGVRTILDVGSGTGALARRLIDSGYAVDCVSPSISQTERVRTLLGDDAGCIYESTYEALRTDKRYDLILFSESFQYIPLGDSIRISCGLLHPGGHLLICDYFRNETPDRGPFGGGHSLKSFRREVAAHPLCAVAEEEITDRITPNLDLTADFVNEVVAPSRQRILRHLTLRYPTLSRIALWAFRKPLAQADAKYMTGQRGGANFAVYKTYRLLVYRLTAGAPA